MNFKALISKKTFNIALVFALASAIFLSMANFNASCDDLRNNVLRLHIIANSDSKEDQALKLKIRDRILENSIIMFDDVIDIESAFKVTKEKLDDIEELANEVIKEEGFPYKATAEIGKSYFETREYDDFTLPAGEYNSLIIRLGKSSGKNWWCVIFPQICVGTATKGKLEDTVSKESAEVAQTANRYILRFKAVEIYEDIKKLISK